MWIANTIRWLLTVIVRVAPVLRNWADRVWLSVVGITPDNPVGWLRYHTPVVTTDEDITSKNYIEMHSEAEKHLRGNDKLVLLFSAKGYHGLIADSTFSNWFDPATAHVMLTQGYLGMMLGLEVCTDGFFHTRLRFTKCRLAFYVLPAEWKPTRTC